MQVVLHTHSASWAESVRLALVGEGIDAIVMDQYSPGILGLQGSLRVAVTSDADVESALRVLRGMEPPKGEPLPSWRWHKRALLAWVATILMLFVIMSTETAPRSVRLVAIGAGLMAFVSAIVFFVLGSRADARLKPPAPDA